MSNAGIGSGRPDATTRQESRDGLELRFAVNHLAGFALTLRLLGLLQRSAPARVVLVASLAQAPVDFDDVQLERDYDGGRAYAQSKLAQITTGFELADRLAGTGVSVTSLHPATYMPTKIVLEQAGRSVDTLERASRRRSASRSRPSSRASRVASTTARTRPARTRRPTTPTRAGGSGTSAAS